MPCGCRLHGDSQVWGSLCDTWDSALQMMLRGRGIAVPLSFPTLMDGHIAHQLLKPVRAR